MPRIFSQWCLGRKPFPLYSTGKPVCKDVLPDLCPLDSQLLVDPGARGKGFAYEIWRTSQQSLKQGNVICFRELFK